MNCNHCNAWVLDDATFCSECGQKIEAIAPSAPTAQSFCPNCGAAMGPGDVFCGSCGNRVGAPDGGQNKPKKKVKKTRKSKVSIPRIAVLGAVAVAAVVVLIIAVSAIFGGGSSGNYALYVKDGQLQYANMPKASKVTEVTSRLFDGDTDSEDEVEIAWELPSVIQMSSDGKKLFYPDKIDADEEEFTLYCRDIKNSKKEPVKIDSGITGYSINEKGTLVVYEKNDNLYRHDLTEKTKIASDIYSYTASADCQTLLYRTTEDNETYDLYIKKGDKDEEKIASNVTSVSYISEDLSLIVYRKDDSLYIKKGNEDAVKIASDVISVLSVYDSGEVYYTKAEESEITHWSVIKDDMNDADYTASYSEWMQEETMSNPLSTLCYFDGKESTVVSESMVEYYSAAADSAVMVVQLYDGDSLPAIKLSEYIESEYSLYTLLSDAIEDSSANYVVMGAVTEELDIESVYNVRSATDGKTLYVAADRDEEEQTVSLYKVELSGGKIKNSELFDDDVYTWSRAIVNDSSILYFKDVNEDEAGELYLDGKMVDDDVHTGSYQYNTETDCLYYIQDMDMDKAQGTLMYYNGKETVTVKDDVLYYYCFTPEGQALFLYDYSMNSYQGELWIQNGKKVAKLDDDVMSVFTVN